VDGIRELPDWVRPPLDAVAECYRVVCRFTGARGEQRERGVFAVFSWWVVGDTAPLTHRSGIVVTREAARSESWVALCLAAGMPPPTARDWQRLSADPALARTTDREFAYGAWRALAWLLGVREDWPAHGAWHRAAEIAPERPHLAVPRDLRNTPGWLAAQAASWEQAEADALAHWRHTRRLADATDR